MNNHFDNQLDDQYDDLQELGAPQRIKNAPVTRGAKKIKKHPIHSPETAVEQQMIEQNDDRGEFNYTYKASRHENVWLTKSLGGFFEQHWFDDVLRMIKGGKEASVYLCRANEVTHTDFLAAKVYRPRQFRALKNDAIYREGRGHLDGDGHALWKSNELHAIAKRTDYGMELMHTSWIDHEFVTMQVLHEAGADIPAPFARANNAILMEYIGDEELSAPTLNDVDLAATEAHQLFQRVLHNIEIMLRCGRVHGDLSAFNILYWDGEITLIDFPQAMNPEQNNNTFRIFERDVTRVCEYFATQGVRSDARKLASNLWTAYSHSLTPKLDPRLLDADSEADRALWKDRARTQS